MRHGAWARWLLVVAALALACHVHLHPYPLWIRYVVLALLGLASAWALRVVCRQFAFERLSAVVLFTCLWGHTIFNGYVYFDELTRTTAIPPFTRWWTTPVNDHLLPWLYPVWFVQYRLLHGDYAGIAIFQYVAAVVGIVAFGFVIAHLAADLSPSRRLMLVWAGTLSTHSYMLWSWKGCGDGPVFTFMWLALWLAALLAWGPNFKLEATVGCLGMYLLMVGSSSLITIGFVYALPLLWIESYRNRSFAAILAGGATVSIGYWFLRAHVLPASVGHVSSLRRAASGMLGLWLQFGGASGLATAACFFLSLLGAWLLRKGPRRVQALWMIAALICLIGTAQLVAGRGLRLENSERLSRYHMYFPFIGCSLLTGLGVVTLLRDRGSGLVVALLVALVAAELTQQHLRNRERAPRNDAVIALRRQFFGDLRRLRGTPIPNRSLADSRVALSFDWYPDKKTGAEWREIVRISSLQQFVGGGLQIVRRDSEPTARVREFFERYW